MKNDFVKMEEEMDLLSQNMNNIVTFSSDITSTLHERRAKITQLHGVHELLKKVSLYYFVVLFHFNFGQSFEQS